MTKNLSKRYLSQIQIALGKKADEIKTYIDQKNNNVEYNLNVNTHNVVQILSKEFACPNCNIFIRLAVWDCLNTTTIALAQKLQNELLMYTKLTKCKVSKSMTKSMYKGWVICEWNCAARGQQIFRKIKSKQQDRQEWQRL